MIADREHAPRAVVAGSPADHVYAASESRRGAATRNVLNTQDLHARSWGQNGTLLIGNPPAECRDIDEFGQKISSRPGFQLPSGRIWYLSATAGRAGMYEYGAAGGNRGIQGAAAQGSLHCRFSDI